MTLFEDTNGGSFGIGVGKGAAGHCPACI